jgi:hypothetical protein
LWSDLKKEPNKPTSKNIAAYILHTQWLISLQDEIGLLPNVPEQNGINVSLKHVPIWPIR